MNTKEGSEHSDSYHGAASSAMRSEDITCEKVSSDSCNPFRNMKVDKPRILKLTGNNVAYIISNRFENEKNAQLLGNIKDEEYIENTFRWLNFDIFKHLDLSAVDLSDLIDDIGSNDYDECDCIACFFLTHGDDRRLITAADMYSLSLDKIVKKFVENPTLFGKPKLFFFQTCRGSDYMKAVTATDNSTKAASGSLVWKAMDADTLLYFPTTQGNRSYGNKKFGSYFIACLCKVLQEYGGQYSLDDAIIKVNEILSTSNLGYCQTKITGKEGRVRSVEVSEVSHTMTYKIFFQPNGNYADFVS